MPTLRGADLVARTLDAAGLTTIFTLSGNHIMPLFDAALGTRLRLIHVRHEAAAVHSGKPACVNVMIERIPAPIIRRPDPTSRPDPS